MSTSLQVENHLEEMRAALNAAAKTVYDYQKFGSRLTAGNRTTELAKVTTIDAALLHASNCSICVGWDGS